MRKAIRTIVMALLLALISGEIYGLTIFSDNFDGQSTRLSAWKESSTTYVTRYTGAYKIGTASMQISGAYNVVTYVNTLPFSNIVLTFKMAAYSLESTDKVQAFYNVGSGDVICATLADGSDNGSFRTYTISIPKGVAGFKFGFKLVGGSGDYGYIDDVVLTGTR